MTDKNDSRPTMGRPPNNPGPQGWDPAKAHAIRFAAGITTRSIKFQLEDDYQAVLSERAVEHYFLDVDHPQARAPRADVADAIAAILGVTREEIGVGS